MLASAYIFKLVKDVAVIKYWFSIARDVHFTIWVNKLINELVFHRIDCIRLRALFHLPFLDVWQSKLGLRATTPPMVGDCLYLDELFKDALDSLHVFICSLKFWFNNILLSCVIYINHLLKWFCGFFLLKVIVIVWVLPLNFVVTRGVLHRLRRLWGNEGGLRYNFSLIAWWAICSSMTIWIVCTTKILDHIWLIIVPVGHNWYLTRNLRIIMV